MILRGPIWIHRWCENITAMKEIFLLYAKHIPVTFILLNTLNCPLVEMKLNYIETFSSYRAVNTPLLGYNNKSFKVV
jgi:hypothetical protein